MKKKLVWLLAGLMVVSMLGCGKNTEKTDATKTAEEQTATTEESGASEGTTATTEETTVPSISEIENIDQYVTLNDYKNVTVSVSKQEVTDTDVEAYINTYLLSYYEVTGRPVQQGDIAVIDYTGYMDGEAFEGGTDTGYQLQIGSNSFIAGFEDGLVGVNAGETKDLELSFPDPYYNNPDLAGKPVTFTVTVNQILETAEYASVTDEQIAKMGLEYSTKEAVWTAAVDALNEKYESDYTTNVQTAILETIVAESTFGDLPEEMIEATLDSYIEYFSMMCYYYYGADLETYLSEYMNMTVDEYRETIRENVIDELKQEFALEAIARAENLVPSEEEVLIKAQEYVDTNGYESVDALYEAGGGKGSFVTYLTQNNVMEYLESNAKVE